MYIYTEREKARHDLFERFASRRAHDCGFCDVQGKLSCIEGHESSFAPIEAGTNLRNWVLVKELKLIYHNEDL